MSEASTSAVAAVNALRADLFTVLQPGPSQETIREIIMGAQLPGIGRFERLDVLCHRLVAGYRDSRHHLAKADALVAHLESQRDTWRREAERLQRTPKPPKRQKRGKK